MNSDDRSVGEKYWGWADVLFVLALVGVGLTVAARLAWIALTVLGLVTP